MSLFWCFHPEHRAENVPGVFNPTSPFEYLLTCLIGVQGPLGCLSGPASRRISADGTDEMDISLVGDFAAWVEESITSSGEHLHFLMLSLHKISQHQFLSVSEL